MRVFGVRAFSSEGEEVEVKGVLKSDEGGKERKDRRIDRRRGEEGAGEVCREMTRERGEEDNAMMGSMGRGSGVCRGHLLCLRGRMRARAPEHRLAGTLDRE